MSGVLARLRSILPGIWLGGLAAVAGLATPALFALLPNADAARVAGRVLAGEAWSSLVLGVVVLLIERAWAQRRAEAGAGSRFSGAMLLVLGALFCTVAGYFAVQPQLTLARSGRSMLSFAQWHALSVGSSR
ncbi:MAG: DUF4149 domain-containing protein [Burkholderiaceae bacterium]